MEETVHTSIPGEMILVLIFKYLEKNQADDLFNAFSTKFPNIKVNHSVELSKYLDGRINQAFLQNELYADMAILQTLQDYGAWEEKGVLLNYKPPSFDKIWPSLTNPNGAYLPIFAGMPSTSCHFLVPVATRADLYPRNYS